MGESIDLEMISRLPSRKSKSRATPLLFIHGAWLGAWCWDEHFLPYFAEHGYEAHAVSLRGHGNSPGVEKLFWWNFSNYVEDIEYAVSKLSAPPVLIGHSMGGYTVQKYLERHKAPAGVLMASIPTMGTLLFSMRMALKHPYEVAKAALTLNPGHVLGKPGVAHDVMFSMHMAEEKVAKYASRLQSESVRVLFDTAVLNLPNPKKVQKTPLLVLGAENDTIFGVREIRATARRYGTRAEIFPNMAHNMMLEDNWQVAADRIIHWLQQRNI